MTIAIKPDTYLTTSQKVGEPVSSTGMTWLQYAAKHAHRKKVVPDHSTARFALFLGSKRFAASEPEAGRAG